MTARAWMPLAFLLLLGGTATFAEEKVPQAEARYLVAVKAFPAPAEAHAFRYAGPVYRGRERVGRFKTSVAVAPAKTKDAAPLWRLRFSYNLGPDTHAAEAYVARDLAPVRGTVTTTTEGEEATWTWAREGKALRVTHTSGSTRPMTRAADVVEPALTTVPGFLLFARLAPDGSGRYATRRLDPTWNHLLGQRPYVQAPIRITAPAKPGAPLQLEAGFGTRTLTAELDRMRRLPAWFKLTPRKGPALQFGGDPGPGPDGAAEEAVGDDVFAKPATSPEAAALRAAYAFATADREVLDDVMHWPGLRKRLGAKVPERVSAEAFRKAMLGQLIATVREPRKPDAVKPVLRDIAKQLTTAKRDGGVTRVTFPERFSTRWYDVIAVDGVWKLVGWPGN